MATYLGHNDWWVAAYLDHRASAMMRANSGVATYLDLLWVVLFQAAPGRGVGSPVPNRAG